MMVNTRIWYYGMWFPGLAKDQGINTCKQLPVSLEEKRRAVNSDGKGVM